jgi:hypothetical protein
LEWGLGATTHEISHLVIHQAPKNPFGDLPRWLDEGIAVYHENQDELDDDFRMIFEQAVKQNKLMTLRTLSSPFPSDPLLANLAYGQSGAVVKFIVDHYGREAMANLLDIFAEGALYDEALQQALGVDTDGLDNAFRASLGMSALPGTEQVEAVPVEPGASDANEAEVSEPTQAEGGVAGEPEASLIEDAPEEQVSEPETGAAAEPAPAQPEPQQVPNPVVAVPCVAGLLPLLVFGIGAALKRSVV